MTPPRKWFQIHLSTAILLMLVTGAMIGLNLVPRVELILIPSYWQDHSYWQEHYVEVEHYGWPVSAVSREKPNAEARKSKFLDVRPFFVLVNAGLIIGAILITWSVAEEFTVHRERS